MPDIGLLVDILGFDLALLAMYVAAVRFSKNAAVPCLAFIVTLAISFIDMPLFFTHALYAAVYLVSIPLSNIKVAFPMLASSVVNFLAAFYFVSPAYLVDFEVYFMTAMIVINLYILLTIFRGVKDGKPYALGNTASGSYMDLQHIQTHQTQNKRG